MSVRVFNTLPLGQQPPALKRDFDSAHVFPLAMATHATMMLTERNDADDVDIARAVGKSPAEVNFSDVQVN